VDEWRRPGPTAAQRRVDAYIAAVVVAGALLSVSIVNSAGVFVFGSPPPWPEQVCWAVGSPCRWPGGAAGRRS
jgi:hypothetical protein